VAGDPTTRINLQLADTLSNFVTITIPHNLPVLNQPLDAAAERDGIIDFGRLSRRFTLALFGELAFGVSSVSIASETPLISRYRWRSIDCRRISPTLLMRLSGS